MNIQELIAAERAKLEAAKPTVIPVVLGGQKIKVGITRLVPADWANLAAAHAPRAGGADDGVGYNQETLPGKYPVARITLNDETPEQGTWAQMYEVLEPVHKATIGNVIWGLNVYAGIKELQGLGKATAGKPSDSPAN